jgi:hypothetical protein
MNEMYDVWDVHFHNTIYEDSAQNITKHVWNITATANYERTIGLCCPFEENL